MKKIILIAILLSANAFAADTLSEMTMTERLSDLQTISENSLQTIEQIEQAGDSAALISGTVCFNIGNTFASIRVLRTLKAGLPNQESQLNQLVKRAYVLKNKFCSK